MDDPLLRAWTTQYTNSPITTPRSATPGECRLRPPRDERVEKPRHPKNPPTPPSMSMPYAVSSVPQGNMCNVDRGNGALEYINPSLLLFPQDYASQESNNYASARRVSDRRIGQSPYTRPNTPNVEGVSNVSSSDQRSSLSGRNGREEQSNPPVDIFEGILAKMLAFDVVRPPSTNELGNDEPPREVEAKQPKEGSGHSRNTVDTVGHF